jgi:uncharacterized membrane protein YkvA (DUF1232 family)
MNDETSSKGPNFFDLLTKWLRSLPTDVKIVVKMIGDDELDMKARTLAVGTVLYILSPIDLIPDIIPVLGYIDDAIIMRIVLVVITEIDPERAIYYRVKYPEMFEPLERQIQILKETLGALYSWLRAIIDRLPKRHFHGKPAEEVVNSKDAQEEMFDEVMEYVANIDTDSKTIQDALLGAPPNRIIELISSGLEKEQKLEQKSQTGNKISASADKFRKLLGRGE